MNNHCLSTVVRLLSAAVCLMFLNPSSDAAVALTKRGPREGRVIVREFDRLVITIMTPDRRLFQYYARDIESITATEKVLVGVKTPLREKPATDAETITDLSKGLEVIILDTPKNSDWLKVRGWGSNEGWIPKKALTDKVVFTAEEKQDSLRQPFAANEAKSASGTVTAASPEVSAASAALSPATPEIPAGTPTLSVIQSATSSVPAATGPVNVKDATKTK